MPRQIISDCGFTLLELMVAMMLLTVGFLATFSTIWSSQKAGDSSRNITTAGALGLDLMEQLALRNYTGLKSGSFSFATTTTSAARFSRSYTVQVDTPGVNLKTVTGVVSWTETAGSKNRIFTTVRRVDF